jgi:FAD/FMN-containing dehydrogenase
MATLALPIERLAPLENYGHSIRAIAYVYRPTHVEQVAEVFRLAEQTGQTVALRGAGRSYGDAALNSGQIVLDLQRMNRILAWDPATGIIKVEPGVTLQQIWTYTLEDGYWPPVTSGTMFPTIGGALGMNIHGKNNWKAGTLGEHVLAFDALLPNGQLVTCTPTENADLFYSLIGSAGLLGVFTSVTLKLKRVETGFVRVYAWATPTLKVMLDDLDRDKDKYDYIVGWLDGLAGGSGLGRGQIHGADYVHADEDPSGGQSLKLSYQDLPDTFFGVMPKSMLWRFMTPFMSNAGTWLINTAKYLLSRTLEHHKTYLQSIVAFTYLLDYVPNWERSYGKGGLIQYQSFLPLATAHDAWHQMLELTHKHRLPTYLGVTKRHRPDKFLLTHAVDGYSLAMDFKVTGRPGTLEGNRRKLNQMTSEMSEIVLAAGGRHYFAKDSTMTPQIAARYLGDETLAKFKSLKQRCDPHGLLQTDLYRRLLAA